jgi:formylglycine-generating enzyme required for sulfatase activity
LPNAEWLKWIGSDAESWREASTTAVTTYPQGVSKTGVWDGTGNVWEWMNNPHESSDTEMPLRGGGWLGGRRSARASSRLRDRPELFSASIGLRVVVAPVLQ